MDPFVAVPPDDTPLRVGLLLIDGFALLSYASVTEPLRVANLLSGRKLYHPIAVPASGAAARSSGGVLVEADAQVGETVDLDLMLVIAAGDPFRFADARVLQWLRLLARRGVTLGGVSGGPVVLAMAGLMQGHRMTLHWEHAAPLAERWPELVVERSLYVFDRQRLSCAGGTAPLDLMHAMIAWRHGAALAREVSDWLHHTEVRPGGGEQRAGLVERYGIHHAPLLEAIGAMETHLSDPLSLQDLARITGVGQRHLTRLFTDRLHDTPMRFYRRLRLERARALLRQSGLDITGIARATGFTTTAHFSTAYRERYGHAPTRERREHSSRTSAEDGTFLAASTNLQLRFTTGKCT